MLYKVKSRSLTVQGKGFQVLEWKENVYSAWTISSKLSEVLNANGIVFFQVGSTKLFTTDAGFFHIQMELLDFIELV